MHLSALMLAIQRKRQSLGISQQRLADLAGLSRQTLNGIERGTVNVTLENLVRLLDVLGLSISIDDPDVARAAAGKPPNALRMAALGANVSYSGDFTPELLDAALATGETPQGYRAHVAQVLDEAPLQLIVKAVAEVAARHNRKPAEIWRNLHRLAASTSATRDGLWK
ncbi:helix-turn-helix domain-containing protein [Cupriavidus sp. SW-Y-13]|nr:helix-turn-helix domain-containing protein [Cupriavidus sp. SW-Y-13]